MTVIRSMLEFVDKRIVGFGAQYRTFGIFGVLNYPLCYFILYYLGNQTNEDLTVRLLATCLCVPLVFVDFWSLKAKKYLNAYWLFAILYCLPFLGTYMLLKNHISTEWLMNEILGLFLLILLVDWLVFVAVLSTGIGLGYLTYIAFNHEIIVATYSHASPYLTLYIYAYAILIGFVFARNKEYSRLQEKAQNMEMLAGAIAHELRTPLAAISMTANALKKSLTSIMTKAQETDSFLLEVPDRLNATSRNAFTIIDMVLMNLKDVSQQNVSNASSGLAVSNCKG